MLECGHIKAFVCHAAHQSIYYQCREPCSRNHKCGHTCKYLCFQCKIQQQPCYQQRMVVLPCQHSTIVKCHYSKNRKFLEQIKCEKICKRNHGCEHDCQYQCFSCRFQKQLCKKKITYTLSCSHKTEILCYQSKDFRFIAQFKCQERCIRGHKCRHPCAYKCFQCNKQKQRCFAEKLVLLGQCGHQQVTQCYKVTEKLPIQCQTECNKILPCKHKCSKFCGENCSEISTKKKNLGFLSSCQYKVLKRMPCLHYNLIECGLPLQKYFQSHKCSAPCNQDLECGHQCPNKCSHCYHNLFHGTCNKICDKIQLCSHVCQSDCGECPPCRKQCEMSCAHKKCSHFCGEECEVCHKACTYKCIHSDCTKKCFELCNRAPCDYRCSFKLKCGHSCLGLCGQKCPDLCRICDPLNQNFNALLGNQERQNSKFVQLLSCGHSFEVKDLDKYMRGEEQEKKQMSRAVCYKKCPRCDTLITNCPRYQDLIKRTKESINKIKAREEMLSKLKREKLRKLLKQHHFHKLLPSLPKRTLPIFKELLNRLEQSKDIASLTEAVTLTNSLRALELIAKLESKYSKHFSQISQVIKEIEQQLLKKKIAEKRMAIFFRCIRVASMYLCLKVKQSLDLFSDSNSILERVKYNRLLINDSLHKTLYNAYSRVVGQGSQILAEEEKTIGLNKGEWYECSKGHLKMAQKEEKNKCQDCNKQEALRKQILIS